jgi:hypothetical protein
LERRAFYFDAVDEGPVGGATVNDVTGTVGVMKNKSVLPAARRFRQLHVAGRRSADKNAGHDGEIDGIVGGECGADGLQIERFKRGVLLSFSWESGIKHDSS